MTVDWTTMVEHVVIAGRPGDVKSAALGWEQLLRQAVEVKESLERDVTQLSLVWSGPAFESYRSHILGIARRMGSAIEQAQQGAGVVHSLQDAAEKLADAQAAMPVPHGMVGQLLAARNGEITLGPKFCEVSMSGQLLDNPVTRFLGKGADFAESLLSDVQEAAARVYDKANADYQFVKASMPAEVQIFRGLDAKELSIPSVRDSSSTPPSSHSPPHITNLPHLALSSSVTPLLPPESPRSDPGRPHSESDTPRRGSDHIGLGNVEVRRPPVGADQPFSGSGLAGIGGGGFAPSHELVGHVNVSGAGSGGGVSGMVGPVLGAFPSGVPGGGSLGRPLDLGRTLSASGLSGGVGGASGGGGPGMAVAPVAAASGTPANNSKESGQSSGRYSKWLTEDKSTWDAPDDCAPPVLGKPDKPASDWPEGLERLRFVRRD